LAIELPRKSGIKWQRFGLVTLNKRLPTSHGVRQ
jgi:hypothetical protein